MKIFEHIRNSEGQALGSLGRFRLVFVAGGLTTVSLGVYSLVSQTNIFCNLNYVVNNAIVYPVKTLILEPIEKTVKQARTGGYQVQASIKGFIESQESSTKQTESNDSFFVTIYKVGEEIFLTIKEWFKEFSRFIMDTLIPSLKEKSVSEVVEDVKGYLRPMKHMFTRPESDRLQSQKSRWNQYVKAMKTPEFWNSLPKMNYFFLQFQEQLSQLSDAEIAEVIDVYLDNPVEMNKKVILMMAALEKDPDAKAKFSPQLMMDFVRSENIDQLKAELAADQVSRELIKALDFLGLTKNNEISENNNSKIDTTEMSEKITSLFSSIAAFFA